MRDDRIVSSPFSTYFVGGRQPHAESYISGRLVSRAVTWPTIAVVGTASAIAVAFASGVELPDNAARTTRPVEARSDGDRTGQAADTAARPGFSSVLRGARFAGAAEQPGFPASLTLKADSVGEERLAWSAAVLPGRLDAAEARDAAPHVRPARVKNGAASSRAASAFASPVVGGCAPNCPGRKSGQAKSDIAVAVPEQAEVSSSPPVPRLGEETELQGEGPGPDGEGVLRSSASGLVADAGPVNALLADAQPSYLIESTGELIVAESTASHSLAVSRIEPGGEPKSLPLESPRFDVKVGAGVEPVAPHRIVRETAAVSIPGRTSEPAQLKEPLRTAEPGQAIAHHLERISARYAAAAPAGRTVIEESGEDQTAEPLASSPTPNTPSIVSSAEVLSTAPVIIQDDELVSIKLGELVSLFEDRLDRPLYVWMKRSKAASKFVTVETLAAAGIGAKYDAERKQVIFSVAAD